MRRKQYLAGVGTIAGLLMLLFCFGSLSGHMFSGVTGAQAAWYVIILVSGMLLGTGSYVAFRYFRQAAQDEAHDYALRQSTKTLAASATPQLQNESHNQSTKEDTT